MDKIYKNCRIVSGIVICFFFIGFTFGKPVGNLQKDYTQDSSCLGAYLFDGDATDASDNNRDGSVTGATLATGYFGQAYDFDGINDDINIGSASDIDDQSPISLVMWVNLDTTGASTNPRLFSKRNFPNDGYWEFLWSDNSGNPILNFTITYDTTNISRASAVSSGVYGEWAHWAVTWNGGLSDSDVKIYKNGVEVNYGTNSDGSGDRTSDAASSLFIGNLDGSIERTVDGRIDEVGLFNRVLDISEIKEIMNHGLRGNQ